MFLGGVGRKAKAQTGRPRRQPSRNSLTRCWITGILGTNAAWRPRPARNSRRPATS